MDTEIRILLLEDVVEDAERMESELRDKGISFVSQRVQTPSAFIEALEQFHPDIVLADPKLPAFDGLSAVQIVRQRHCEIPVVLVADRLGEEAAVELLKDGVSDFVPKDRLVQLAPTVRRAIEEKRREHKLAKKTHGEIEQKLRAILDQASQLIGLLTTDGILIDANRTALDFAGLKAADVLGKPFWETPWWTHSPALQQQLRDAIVRAAKGEVVRFEATHRAADGSLRYLDFALKSIRDENGRVKLLVPTSHDITERKQAQETIRESEKHCRSLFDHMLEGFAFCRMLNANDQPADFIYIDVNPAFEQLTGLNHVVGKKVSEVIPGLQQSNPEIFEIYGRVASGGKPERFETYIAALGIWFSISVYSPEKEHFVAVFDNITERKRTEAKIHKLTQLYATLSHTNEIIVHATDQRSLLCNICQGAVEQGRFAMAWVGLVDEETRSVLAYCQHGCEEGYLANIRIDLDEVSEGQDPTVTAIREKRVILVNDLAQDLSPFPWRMRALRHGFRGTAAIPFAVGSKAIGALTLYVTEANFFDEDQTRLLEEMSTDISYALESLLQSSRRQHAEEAREATLQQLKKTLVDTIKMAASTIEMRDPYTAGHQQRVARLATAIAREMGLDETRIEGIYFGGLIHDIGKISVPAEILSKPRELTSLEMDLIRAHAEAGYQLVRNIDLPWPVAQMIGQHHELLDGSGYPFGLIGDDIVLEARILTVADVVEAMSSHRPYRPSLGIETALEEISHYRERRYDRRVVDACLCLFREKGFSFDKAVDEPGQTSE